MEIGISLGSNIGDRLTNISLTIEKISLLDNVSIIARSTVYQTEPVLDSNAPENPDFLNCVILLSTDLKVEGLQDMLQALEVDMGRPADHPANMPRTIDIDIIYADTLEINTPELHIPHPRWSKRRFVAQPLADLRPNLVIPGCPDKVRDVLLSLPEIPNVVPYEPLPPFVAGK